MPHDESIASRSNSLSGTQSVFPRTSSTLLGLAFGPDETARTGALQSLCQMYWYPLYCYARRFGCPPLDAQDVVQDFFVELLQKDFFAQFDPAKGRLRAFLLGMLKLTIGTQRRHERAQKRGGGTAIISLDVNNAERTYAAEPLDIDSPDKLFERRWALTILDGVLDEIGREWEERGAGLQFTTFRPLLFQNLHQNTCVELSTRLGLTAANVKVKFHRLRQSFGARLRRWVAETVADPEDVDGEIAALQDALR